MSDVSGNTTASSLAITEKRTTTHRTGGCVGIFFQLFDWNRRFAKKKLFSKKLLPPARAKQTSKKLKGNEKKATSKLHLISDENEGGFPKMRKNAKSGSDSEHKSYEASAPSLVARLMGLESMPVAAREKPKKGAFSEACGNGGNGVNSVNVFGNIDVKIEKRSVKLDSRPQKVQKTGQSESQAVIRVNPESAFQLKNVLSRSRKHYHHHNHRPKFVSPVKSPRIPSGKNVSRTSRLIDAATRILEPGLQSSSRRNSLTYTGSVHYLHPNTELLTERMMHRSEEQIEHTPIDSFTAQNSCKSCGNLLDVNSWPSVEQELAVFPYSCSDYPNSCSAERTEREERNRGWDRPVSPIRREKEETYDVRSNNKHVKERKFMRSEGLAPWPSSNRPRGFQNDGPSSVNNRKRVQTQDQMPVSRDRTPPRNGSRPSNVESRRVQSPGNAVRGNIDFVSLNRNVSAHSRPRVPTRVDNSNKYFMEKRAFDGREEILPQLRSPVRKRTNNFGGQVESKGHVASTPLTNQSYTRGRLVGSTREADRETKSNSNGVNSFTLNSPLRQRLAGASSMEKKAVDKEINMTTCREPPSFKGDSIAALLEQKLKELTSQEDDEVVMGSSPRRSTAMILQELISALTAERPDIALASTAETKHERSGGKPKATDHLSPGSVLGASFSSSSMDDSSGHRLYTDSIDYSSDQTHYLGPESDILDSASSSQKDTTGFERVMGLVTTVSRVLNAINLAGGRLTELGLNHAKQVVLNAELLFGNAQLFRLDGLERLFLGPILLELEAIANIAWTNINMLTGSDPAKSGNNQYRGFLFDCLIECLERKYGHHPNSGFGAWRKIPQRMDRETIIGDVENDMKKWTRFAGMATDEIVEWEMSHSLGKWTNFDIEAFEIGAEASEEILDALVDETLIGLWG